MPNQITASAASLYTDERNRDYVVPNLKAKMLLKFEKFRTEVIEGKEDLN